MRKLTLSIVLLTIMTSLVACGGNKDNENETKPTLEVIKPTETEPQETLSDKLDETKTYTVPTIATTEGVDSNGEEVTIGITETLEDNSYIGVTPDNDVVVTMAVPELSSGHEYTESEAIAVEGLAQYWSENNVSEEVLATRLEDEVFSGLSDTDKAEIVDSISSANPHNNPEITEVETTEATTEPAETSDSVENIQETENSAFLSDEDMEKWFGGADGELSVTEDPNLNLQSGN